MQEQSKKKPAELIDKLLVNTGQAIDPSRPEALCRLAEGIVLRMLDEVCPELLSAPEDLRTACKTAAQSIITLRLLRDDPVDFTVPGLTDEAMADIAAAMTGDHTLSEAAENSILFALFHIDQLCRDPDVRRHMAPERIMISSMIFGLCDTEI